MKYRRVGAAGLLVSEPRLGDDAFCGGPWLVCGA